ncbi:unnamed protein product [Trichobilharzia regenti]|nr:unnamed protein product [Trichobilharzia regenti]
MRWIPLEANPKYMNNLGVVDSVWKFTDVFSLDDDMLAFIPQPVISLLFLYPLGNSIENASLGVEDNSSKVILIKQTVGNACGTIAILNAIANNRDKLSIKGKFFHHLSVCSNLFSCNKTLIVFRVFFICSFVSNMHTKHCFAYYLIIKDWFAGILLVTGLIMS